jgi:hypothetical protein
MEDGKGSRELFPHVLQTFSTFVTIFIVIDFQGEGTTPQDRSTKEYLGDHYSSPAATSFTGD